MQEFFFYIHDSNERYPMVVPTTYWTQCFFTVIVQRERHNVFEKVYSGLSYECE